MTPTPEMIERATRWFNTPVRSITVASTIQSLAELLAGEHARALEMAALTVEQQADILRQSAITERNWGFGGPADRLNREAKDWEAAARCVRSLIALKEPASPEKNEPGSTTPPGEMKPARWNWR